MLPEPIKRFLRGHIGAYVWRYGFQHYHFHPAPSITEQIVSFKFAGRTLTVRADHHTGVYDMIYEVVDYDTYQLSEIRWEPCREHHIVDIGANVGVTALVLSQLPGAKVTCYEPHPDNCTFLRRNLELNQIKNVRVIQAAVDRITGTAEFGVGENSEGGFIVRGPSRPAQKLTVSTVAFDQVVEDCNGHGIDLIKIDCEGGEYAIIDQITPQLADRILNISLEVHDINQTHNLQSISAKLAALGYKLTSKDHGYGYLPLHMLLARRT